MSTHATTHRTTTTTSMRKEVDAAKVLRRLALGACATIALIAIAAAPAPAINQDHADRDIPSWTPAPSTPPVSSPPNSHNYPKEDLGYGVPSNGSVGGQGDGLEATSVALGALGGIALTGAGLGITLGVQRRREHPAPHTA